MGSDFRDIFEPEDPAIRARSKFLSRVFGIFSEQVVAIWANDERARYQGIGRPTLRSDPSDRGHTLDFTLVDRVSERAYVAEMKCEIEYKNFRYFVLDNAEKLDHHRKPAFVAFLLAASSPEALQVQVAKKEVKCSGAVLIWGAMTPEGRDSVITATGMHDVLSVEDICSDLRSWQNEQYLELVRTRREWCDRLFARLAS